MRCIGRFVGMTTISELVDVLEFGGLGLGGAGHAGELLVEAEVVLEGNGGQRLIFLADVDAFLSFDGLMKAVGPAAAGHKAAGELVDDDDLAVLDHVLDVALVERVRLRGDLNVVLHVPVLGVGLACRCRAGAFRSSPSPRR